MARLVTKFKFLKPGGRKGAGGYAKYIATREGVERIDDSQRLAPATKQQETLIEKINGFTHALLYQSIRTIEDSFDIEGMEEASR